MLPSATFCVINQAFTGDDANILQNIKKNEDSKVTEFFDKSSS